MALAAASMTRMNRLERWGSRFALGGLLCLASAPATAAPDDAGRARVEASATVPNPELADAGLERKVEALLAQMTLAEKVGQMVQFPASRAVVGPEIAGQNYEAMIAVGEIGALNVADLKRANAYQHSLPVVQYIYQGLGLTGGAGQEP